MVRFKKLTSGKFLGPVLAVGAIFVLEGIRMSPLIEFMPEPASVFSAIVVFSVFRGGARMGYLATVIAIFWEVRYLYLMHGFDQAPISSWTQLISWTLFFPLITYAVGVWQDLSAKKLREHERDKELSLITEAMPLSVFTMDSQGMTTFVNEMWTQFTGMTVEAIQSQGWIQLLHPEDVDGAVKAWQDNLAAPSSYAVQCRVRRKDGIFRWCLFRSKPIFGADGKVAQWIGTATEIHEQLEINDELRKSRERVSLIADTVEAVFYVIDNQGILQFSDGKGLRSVGYLANQRRGISIYDAYAEKPEFIEAFRQALKGQTSKATIRVKGVWFENHLTPRRGPNGEILGVVGLGLDVSARRDAEESKLRLVAEELATKAVRASEAKFKGAFENSPIGIALSNFEGQWVEVSPTFCKMVGFSKDELLTMSMDALTPAEDQSQGKELRRQLINGERSLVSFDKHYRHKNGSLVEVSIMGSVIHDPEGKGGMILSQITDITEKRRSEKLLQESTRRLEAMVNASPAAILALDAEGKLNLWNPACTRMFGWSKEEVLGGPLPFIPPEMVDEVRTRTRQILESPEPFFYETVRMRKDGRRINVSTGGMSLLDDTGKSTGVMAVITDITLLKSQERELREANQQLIAANEAKSGFLANISHEIRTPLNGVLGMTTLLLETALADEQKVYTESIRTSGEILLSLINDVLDFSKIEAGRVDLELIAFDMSLLVQNIRRVLDEPAASKGLTLKSFIDREFNDVSLIGDPTKIAQILVNLVNNAIKFTAKGEVSLNIRHTTTKDGRVGARFEISDKGIGISQAQLTRLFRPFSQADASTSRRYGGTGLGLSICKHLVETMGGQIGVQSEEGNGSKFWFQLDFPVAEAPVAPIVELAPAADAAAIDFKSVRVLLAEDNSVNKMIAVKMLQSRGFSVHAVGNGREAVEALKLAPYNLILMDCQMPIMDGYEASRQIRAQENGTAHIPIIALTANAMKGDREKCLASGMDDYVAKPIRKAELMSTIERVLQKDPPQLLVTRAR